MAKNSEVCSMERIKLRLSSGARVELTPAAMLYYPKGSSKATRVTWLGFHRLLHSIRAKEGCP